MSDWLDARKNISDLESKRLSALIESKNLQDAEDIADQILPDQQDKLDQLRAIYSKIAVSDNQRLTAAERNANLDMQDKPFLFTKQRDTTTLYRMPLEPDFDRCRLHIKFQNGGSSLKDYSLMRNQITIHGLKNPDLVKGFDNGNMGGTVNSIFNYDDYNLISDVIASAPHKQYVKVKDNDNVSLTRIRTNGENGFTVWFRLRTIITFLLNEKRRVLFFKIDSDNVDNGYYAELSPGGDITAYMLNNGVLTKAKALAVVPTPLVPNFFPENYAPENYFTEQGLLLQIEERDIGITFDVLANTIQIVKNGVDVTSPDTPSETANFPAPLSSCTLQTVSAVTASAEVAGNEANKATDNNNATWWQANSLNQWLKIDLGVLKTVCYCTVVFYDPSPITDKRVYNFNIETSTDDINWSLQFSGKSNEGTLTNIEELFDFLNVIARYVRITITANSLSGDNKSAIKEFKVYGGGQTQELPEPEISPITEVYNVAETTTAPSEGAANAGLDSRGILMMYPSTTDPTKLWNWYDKFGNGVVRDVTDIRDENAIWHDPQDPFLHFTEFNRTGELGGPRSVINGAGELRFSGRSTRFYIFDNTQSRKWQNIEMTVFVKLISAGQYPNYGVSVQWFSLRGRSNHHMSAEPCQVNARNYAASVHIERDDIDFGKELIHSVASPDNPDDANKRFWTGRTPDAKFPRSEYVGLKQVVRNIDNNTKVSNTLWINYPADKVTWVKIHEMIDSGETCADSSDPANVQKWKDKVDEAKAAGCLDAPLYDRNNLCPIFTAPAFASFLRTNNIIECYVKDFSIREIDPVGNVAFELKKGVFAKTTIYNVAGNGEYRSLKDDRWARGVYLAASSALIGKTANEVKITLRKVGSPSGEVGVSIWKNIDVGWVHRPSDITFNKIDASSLTTSGVVYTFTSNNDYQLQQGDVLAVWFFDGTLTDHIEVLVNNTDPFDSTRTYQKFYTDNRQWSDATGVDMAGEIIQGSGQQDPSSLTRIGIKAATIASQLIGKLITKAQFRSKRVGSPTGSLFLRVRRRADDAIVFQYASVLCSSVSNSAFVDVTFQNFNAGYRMAFGDTLTLEYEPSSPTPSAADKIEVKTAAGGGFDAHHTAIVSFNPTTGQYTTFPSVDLVGKLWIGGQAVEIPGDEEDDVTIPVVPSLPADLFVMAGLIGYDATITEKYLLYGYLSCIPAEFRIYHGKRTLSELTNLFNNRITISNHTYGRVAQMGYSNFTNEESW